MFEFNGNEYWDLNETSQRLEISKKKVLKRFAREALIRYKDDAVCENKLIKDGEFKGEFEDYKDIKWIDGMFWFWPQKEVHEVHIRLEELFDEQEGLTHVLVQRLTPQNLIGQSLPPSKLRSLCASFDWLVVSDVMLAEIPIDKNTPIYFLVDTVKNFVTKNEIKQLIPLNIDAKSTPLFRQPYQESEILRVIKELGLEALALPKYIQKTKKRDGVNIKARIREVLNWEGTIFEKAWERLQFNKEIRYKDS